MPTFYADNYEELTGQPVPENDEEAGVIAEPDATPEPVTTTVDPAAAETTTVDAEQVQTA